MRYPGYLDSGEGKSRADLARIVGVSRAKVTQMLNLLKLNSEVLEFIFRLEDSDERLKALKERRLRQLVVLGMEEQKERFGEMIGEC